MINSRDINELHPVVRRLAVELVKRMGALGFPVLITSTYRDNESQNALYAQGRTKNGPIVTNARGGESIHNYRLAFDICKNVKGAEYSDGNFFKIAGKIGTEIGLEWGGTWVSFPDTPHFQFVNRLTLTQLQKGAQVTVDIIFPWEQCEAGQESEEDDMVRYEKLEEVPAYGVPTVQKLIDKKYLQGTDKGLNLSEDMLRTFVILDRVGVLG